MSRPLSVVDDHANVEETLQSMARILGKDKIRRAVFSALYGRHSLPADINEIVGRAMLPISKKQQVYNAINLLSVNKIIAESPAEPKNGFRLKRYFKSAWVNARKQRLLKLADNPEQRESMPTKRTPRRDGKAVFTFAKFHKQSPTRAKLSLKHSTTKVELKIVLLATNPHGDLRTDIEVRDIGIAIRKANLRDAVMLKHIPAARLSDLLSELNELRPDVIHISGHGGSKTLVMEDEDNRVGGVSISYELVREFLDATDSPPRVLVLNACDTYQGADVFLSAVEVVVAMSDKIDDAAAGYFATQFYSAICNGQSIDSALKQGKAVLRAGGFQDADLPIALARSGFDLRKYKLLSVS